MTTLLSDVVRVNRRFQRSIRIDTDIGATALEGFVCPPSAADALLTMARQVAETGQGAFTWTGPYGCGKSSLAVAMAALLGPSGRLRDQALAAIGEETARQLVSLIPPGDAGWAVLPVVGRRGDPAAVIGEALAALQGPRRGRRRTTWNGTEVIAQLNHMATEGPGAGLLVLIDEMGKFLEEAAVGGTDVYFFQQLAEAAFHSNRRLVVIGILHQAFDDYAHRLAREVRDEWLKIQGRFADIPINVAGEEQIELIARAIECDHRPDANGVLAAGVAEAIRRNRPGTGNGLERRLHECWPLHPVVASLLGPLSRRRFGQNQRSVFGFLNSAEPHGFQEFLRGTVVGTDVTYEPNRLWDYLRANLEPSILASPDGHRWSLAVEAVERCEARGGDAQHLRLVKTIALIDLFKERSGLLPSPEVLAHALPVLGRSKLDALLEELKGWSIIIYKRHQGAFAIYAGSDFEIDAAVDEARARMTGIDLAKLRSLALLQPVVAKRHYHETGALRWFDMDIAALANGAECVQAYRPQNGATGLFLLLIGTQGENEPRARRLREQAAAAARDWPVAIGWSRDSYTIRELAMELLALETVRAERPELHGDAVARREVNARVARAAAELEEGLRRAFLSATWIVSAVSDGTDATDGQITALPQQTGFAGLSPAASYLADQRYKKSPRLKNELLNRIKPSSNAVAAQKGLLRAMVERVGEPDLGFVDGYPAERGLFSSLLEKTGLYQESRDQPGRWRFVEPVAGHDAGLADLWDAADKLFRGAGAGGDTVAALYKAWQAPPFGVRDGVLPVLAIAFLLSRIDRLAVYLDGVFQPRLGALLIDRLTQDPSSVRLRWSDVTEFHLHVLTGIADLVAEFGGTPAGPAHPEPIAIARGLVAVVTGLKPWVLKTTRLSPTAVKVRDLAKRANDPNKFLLDDIPNLFGGGHGASAADASPVIAAVREGLSELVGIYPQMLRELEAVMLAELRVRERGPAELAELHSRAETVLGLTGNYRLDAFATRLKGYSGLEEEIEGIASLAANRPPRDWVDRDIDQARIEVAALAQQFLKAESLAHVKGRPDKRFRMSIVLSDPHRASPISPDFDIAESQRNQVEELAEELLHILVRKGAERDVALAALTELAARLAENEPAGFVTTATNAVRRRRVS
ncbi:ATP-binding protein [Azospirillum tabaci]|uniref:ATP-binding protein n=1 Tax=Azospirillum tabaci TaxID=2752310 RepID=UPI001660AD10|nr:ATP-binding protein [Azospirillum tabaci]